MMVKGKKCAKCGGYHVGVSDCETYAKNKALREAYYSKIQSKQDTNKLASEDTTNTDVSNNQLQINENNSGISQTQDDIPPPPEPNEVVLGSGDISTESKDISTDKSKDVEEGFKIGIGARENIEFIKFLVKELAEKELSDEDFDKEDIEDLQRAYEKVGISKIVEDPKYYIAWFNFKYLGLNLLFNIRTVIKNIKSKLSFSKTGLSGFFNFNKEDKDANINIGENGERENLPSQ